MTKLCVIREFVPHPLIGIISVVFFCICFLCCFFGFILIEYVLWLPGVQKVCVKRAMGLLWCKSKFVLTLHQQQQQQQRNLHEVQRHSFCNRTYKVNLTLKSVFHYVRIQIVSPILEPKTTTSRSIYIHICMFTTRKARHRTSVLHTTTTKTAKIEPA